MKSKLKKALTNADGTINGKVVAGLISLLIVLLNCSKNGSSTGDDD